MSHPSPIKQQFIDLETEELVLKAQAGDRLALEALVQRFQKRIYMSLYQLAPERNDIMDLTQDVLLRMCRSIHTLKNPKTFQSWINRIMTNLFYDQLRKVPRQLQTISLDAPASYEDSNSSAIQASQDVVDTQPLPEHTLLNHELDQHIQRAIADLPEHFRTIVVLREIQGLSYDEIANILNTNIGTVKSRLARARQRLQEVLSPYIKDFKSTP
ncbi:MAG: sigma-70 family RNA polymerase sigma factor [Cyanobacteria bacterium]|nr:sigma-70 family RNA polymerase sigma factor [Cyanobacteriota bacterium]